MFERFIQKDKAKDIAYLSGKGKKKEAKKKERVLSKAGSYTVKDLENAKKVQTYQGGLQ
tara:strand:+ start:1071 stop:1247 length:177 start_codon:yes stop_codon:yes gene_type:complete